MFSLPVDMARIGVMESDFVRFTGSVLQTHDRGCRGLWNYTGSVFQYRRDLGQVVMGHDVECGQICGGW
jgi:hypothetical protein